MALRRSRGAWLLAALASGACQPLGELPLPPTALAGGGGGKALVEQREGPSASPSAGDPRAQEGEGDGRAADED